MITFGRRVIILESLLFLIGFTPPTPLALAGEGEGGSRSGSFLLWFIF
jgi:hypothetical protein